VAYNSAINLQSTVMERAGFGKLGFYNLALISIFCGVGALFSTSITNRIGVNMSLFIGAAVDAAWILTSLLPTLRNKMGQDADQYLVYSTGFIYTVMLLASCICGFTTGLLWTSQGVYISACASEETKGFYFGFFWSTYTCSQIVGNLVAALVLGNTDEITYFIVMTVIAAVSSFFFITLRKPVKIADPDPKAQLIQTMDPSMSPSQATDSTMPAPQRENVWQNLKDILSCMVSKRLRFFILEIGWTGWSISYFSGMLVLIMTQSMEGIESNP